MDLFESINAGVVNREGKVKAGRLKEGWMEAKCIMAWGEEFMLECSRGPVFTLAARREGWSARKMTDTWYN